MRKLEKISLEEFRKSLDESYYHLYNKPKRGTNSSAGYDFEIIKPFSIKPGEAKTIPTGIKAQMNNDEVLLIIIRSSLGFKNNIRLCNQVGVIDSDYYNNPDNEGHIIIKIQNEGEKEIFFNTNDRIAQGIFIKYLKCNDEENTKETRKGGFGSTN